MPHVFKELLEAVPLGTDRDPATSVVVEALIIGVEAALPHLVPYVVLGRLLPASSQSVRAVARS